MDWFFCLSGAKPFPDWHRFASLNWEEGRGQPSSEPGEVGDAPRPWRDGSPTGAYLGRFYCGDLAQFQQGALSTDPVGPRSSLNEPLCCVGPLGGLILGGFGIVPRRGPVYGSGYIRTVGGGLVHWTPRTIHGGGTLRVTGGGSVGWVPAFTPGGTLRVTGGGSVGWVPAFTPGGTLRVTGGGSVGWVPAFTPGGTLRVTGGGSAGWVPAFTPGGTLRVKSGPDDSVGWIPAFTPGGTLTVKGTGTVTSYAPQCPTWVNQTGVTATSSITFGAFPGAGSGDTMLIFLAYYSSLNVPTTPSGWTKVYGAANGTAGLVVYRRDLTGADTATTISSINTGAGFKLQLRGCGAEDTHTLQSNHAMPSLVAPSVTTAHNGCRTFWIWSVTDNLTGSAISPANATFTSDQRNDSGHKVYCGYCHACVQAAGSTGSETLTDTGGSTANGVVLTWAFQHS